MSPRSLWGQLPESAEVKPPITLLKEQAELLTQMTNGTLHGRVDSENAEKHFVLTLEIFAPYISYTYEVLTATHGIDFYPVTLRAGERRIVDKKVVEPLRLTCNNEEQFEDGLAQVLGSPDVRRVIGALLAQSRA